MALPARQGPPPSIQVNAPATVMGAKFDGLIPITFGRTARSVGLQFAPPKNALPRKVSERPLSTPAAAEIPFAAAVHSRDYQMPIPGRTARYPVGDQCGEVPSAAVKNLFGAAHLDNASSRTWTAALAGCTRWPGEFRSLVGPASE